MRAKMRSALGDERALYRTAADHARFAVPLVDAMRLLKTSEASVGVDVVGYRGATAGDGFGENFANGVVQAAGAGLAEFGGRQKGMNSGAKERFVGVNVADAAEEFLIEQQGFELGLARMQLFPELVEVDEEGLGTEAG